MAKHPTTKTDLEIIGTARKPNFSDLKNRGLIGLPDPDPEVWIRRAEFESEQAELKMRVKIHEGEIAVSFLRTKIDAPESEGDVVGPSYEACKNNRTGDTAIEHTKGEGKIPILTAHVGMRSLPDSPVANEACGSEKAVRVLRNRSAVQLRPYAIEREMYRQMIAIGKVKT